MARNGIYKQWTTEEGQLLLRGWKRAGLTDENIAEKVGIHVSTLYEWQKKYPEIKEALKKGKQLCDYEAEEALINLFKGHYVEDVIEEIDENRKGEKRRHIRKTKRWVDPNTTALIFYLKCRAGWKEQGQEDQTDVLRSLSKMISRVEKEANERSKTV